jgi:hypothetical protein
MKQIFIIDTKKISTPHRGGAVLLLTDPDGSAITLRKLKNLETHIADSIRSLFGDLSPCTTILLIGFCVSFLKKENKFHGYYFSNRRQNVGIQ